MRNSALIITFAAICFSKVATAAIITQDFTTADVIGSVTFDNSHWGFAYYDLDGLRYRDVDGSVDFIYHGIHYDYKIFSIGFYDFFLGENLVQFVFDEAEARGLDQVDFIRSPAVALSDNLRTIDFNNYNSGGEIYFDGGPAASFFEKFEMPIPEPSTIGIIEGVYSAFLLFCRQRRSIII